MKYLVTGAAGFIGYHVSKALIARGDEVIGLDIVNSYYDINLKYARLADLGIIRDNVQIGEKLISDINPKFEFIQLDLAEKKPLMDLFEQEKFDVVIHLAAQAGVRYS
ncbi:MAG: UDP-glucuronate 4-epimerase, partial [Algoriphagus sp.]